VTVGMKNTRRPHRTNAVTCSYLFRRT